MTRLMHHQVSPKVEYGLTCQSLYPALAALLQWADRAPKDVSLGLGHFLPCCVQGWYLG